MRLALDTNILAYAEGIGGKARHQEALALIAGVPQGAGVIPVQVLVELFNVLVRKAGRKRTAARDSLLAWRDAFATVDTSSAALLVAADLATDHQLNIWDSVILATASHAGCRLLLSEDMQDGLTRGGVTIANPFLPTPSPMIEALLGRTS